MSYITCLQIHTRISQEKKKNQQKKKKPKIQFFFKKNRLPGPDPDNQIQTVTN